MATVSRPRGARRTVSVPIYVAVVTDRNGTRCPFADTEREQVELFREKFNSMTGPGSRAVLKVVRYRLPAATGR